MQLDTPRPQLAQLYDWRANVDRGKVILNDKVGVANSAWNTALNAREAWVSQIGPVSDVVRGEGGAGCDPTNPIATNCLCVFSTAEPTPTGMHSFRDAIWMKMYNGNSGGNYIGFSNGTWVFHVMNNPPQPFTPFNYVDRLCDTIP
jgi:hypothetical protein